MSDMSDQRKAAFQQVTWRIGNIKSWLQARDDALYSPQFLAETLMSTRWKLRLSPNCQLEEKYISLTLQRDIDDHPEIIDLNYEISLLTCDGTPLKSKTFMKKFAPKTVGHELYLKEDLILKEKTEAYLPEGVLIVCYKLWKWSTVSKAGQCSVQSVIGTKQLYQEEKIQNFSVMYYPGVISESIKSELSCVVTDLENLNMHDSERVLTSTVDCLHTSDSSDDEEGQSSNQEKYFDATGKRIIPLTTLKEDLTSLYKSHLFCDTKLQTDSETFPVHKSVLSARSPVFYKMFTTDMTEKASECISVPDVSSDTMRRMLRFIYTDFTGDLEMQSAKDLYIASDKYDIASLKQRCMLFMKNNLCLSNVCEVLVLADMHHDKDLESAAKEFVLTYDKEVFCSDEWRDFMEKNSNLAAQVMYLKCTM